MPKPKQTIRNKSIVILRDIKAVTGDPDISIRKIAEEWKISKRTIQKIYELYGEDYSIKHLLKLSTEKNKKGLDSVRKKK